MRRGHAPSSDDDTSVVITSRSSPDVWRRRWSASSQPISSPPRRRQRPVGLRDRRAEPVGVGVVGDGHVGAVLGRRARSAGPSRPAPPGSGTRPSGSRGRAPAARRRRRGAANPARSNARRQRRRRRRRASPCRRPTRRRRRADRRTGRDRAEVGVDARRRRGARSADRPRRRGRPRSASTAVDARGDLGSAGGTICAPVAEVHLVAVVGRRVVRLAVTITPAAAPTSVIVHASTGVGTTCGKQQRPDARRRRHPGRVEGEDVALVAGVVADDHAPLAAARVAAPSEVVAPSPAAAWRTTSRFIRCGPAPTAARRPAVPNCSRPVKRSAQLVVRSGEQRLELGAHVGVGLGRAASLAPGAASGNGSLRGDRSARAHASRQQRPQLDERTGTDVARSPRRRRSRRAVAHSASAPRREP